jgi:hypothetical protein
MANGQQWQKGGSPMARQWPAFNGSTMAQQRVAAKSVANGSSLA